MFDGPMSDASPEVPSSVQRVAELASKLAAFDPSAKEIVRELFAAFSAVQEHFRRPEPIERAPREPCAAVFLFCPEQHGWQAGAWEDGEPGGWVSTLDPAAKLRPTHWMRPAAEP